MINDQLLAMLRCPESKQELNLADPDLLDKINTDIKEGILKNRAGVAVLETIEAGLIRADNAILYPIRDGIPVLLIEEGIEIQAR